MLIVIIATGSACSIDVAGARPGPVHAVWHSYTVHTPVVSSRRFVQNPQQQRLPQ